mgnify:CR=1 FL=1
MKIIHFPTGGIILLGQRGGNIHNFSLTLHHTHIDTHTYERLWHHIGGGRQSRHTHRGKTMSARRVQEGSDTTLAQQPACYHESGEHRYCSAGYEVTAHKKPL